MEQSPSTPSFEPTSIQQDPQLQFTRNPELLIHLFIFLLIKDAIGVLDGTLIHAIVSASDQTSAT